ncbi:MAG: leucine-rich repeat domain-containing protein [Clostridia bacterium]
MKNKKGISLIVLVITIIVIIILAAAVILTLNKSNPIENAKEASFKNDIKDYSEALELYISKQTLDSLGEFKKENLDKKAYKETEKIEGTIKEILPDMKNEYASKFKIERGKLLYVGNTKKEEKWLMEIDMEVRMAILDENGVIIGVKNFENLYGTLEIPKEATGIATGAFFNNKGLEKIDFSKNSKITSIPSGCFRDCSNLKNIILSNSITSIGNLAFQGCISLDDVVIPNSVTDIGSQAFYYCTGLTNIQLSNNPNFKTINNYILCGTKVSNLQLPENITTICMYAFSGCHNLKELSIPKNVSTIYNAFGNCSNLAKINVDANNLNFASYDGSLYSKNYDTLITCPNGKSDINMHANTKTISNNAFESCLKLTTLNIPQNVSTINAAQISNCTNLLNIIIDPNNQDFTFKDGVLYTKDMSVLISGTNTVSNVTVPSTVTSMRAYAFQNCRKLNKIDMSNSKIANIPGRSFENVGLSEILLPSTLKSIESQAFCGTNLTNVTLPEGLTTIHNIAFYSNGALNTVSVPSTVNSMTQPFAACGNLKNITVSPSNPNYCVQDGAIYNKDKSALVCMPGNKSTFTVPNTVKTLKYGCMSYSGGLTNVILPEGLMNIETCAFSYDSSLLSITIPSSVTGIYDAFSECTSLKYINVLKPFNSIPGAPWSAPYGINTVKWN